MIFLLVFLYLLRVIPYSGFRLEVFDSEQERGNKQDNCDDRDDQEDPDSESLRPLELFQRLITDLVDIQGVDALFGRGERLLQTGVFVLLAH